MSEKRYSLKYLCFREHTAQWNFETFRRDAQIPVTVHVSVSESSKAVKIIFVKRPSSLLHPHKW